MSIALRCILIIAAILTFIYVLRRVKKCEMNVGDTVFWIIFSFVLVLLAAFPEIAYYLSDLLGFMAPINLIFMFIIAVLIFKVFSLSLTISKLKNRIAALAQNIGLERNE